MPNPRILEIEQRLRADSKFATLSYQDQMYIRMGQYSQVLKDDEKFQELDPRSKSYIIEQLTTAPPIFKDKQLERYTADLSVRFKEEQKAGVQPAAMPGRTDRRTATDEMLDLTAAYRIHMHGVLFNVIDQKILTPLRAPTAEPGSVGYTRLMEKKDEVAKLVDYFDLLLSKDKRTSRLAQTSQMLGPLMGELTDVAVLYALTAGSLAAPKGLGKLAVNAGKAISFQSKTLAGETFGNLVGAALHAAVGGLIGVTQHIAADAINKAALESANFQEVVYNNLKYFGGYFLGDVIFNVIAGVAWPFAKQVARNFIPGAARGMTRPFFEIGTLSPKEFTTLVDDFVSMKGLDKQLLGKLKASAPETAEFFIDSAKTLAVMKNVKAFSNVEEVAKFAALSKGWRLKGSIAEGYRVRAVLGKTWKNFKSFEAAQAFIVKKIGKLPRYTDDAARVAGAATRQSSIKTVIKGVFKEGAEGDLKVLTRMIAPVGGQFKAPNVKAFTQAYLKARGVSNDIYRTVKTFERGSDVVLEIRKSQVLTIPKKILRAADETTAVRVLTEGIENQIKSAKLRAPVKRALGTHLQQQYGSQISAQQLYTPEWARHASTVDLKAQAFEELPGGRFRLTFADGAVEEFENINKLGQRIVKASMTEEMLGSYLAHEQGLQLVSTETGLQVYRGKLRIHDAPDLDSLLTQNPQLLPKVPDYLGPELTFIDDRAAVLKYVHHTATGRWDQIYDHLNSFYRRTGKRSQVVLSTQKGGRLTLFQQSKHLEVYVPEINHRKVFKNIKEAKAYLDGGWQEWKALSTAATDKGIRLVPWKGRYLARGQGRNMQLLDSPDDVYKMLADTPTPDFMPELSGLDDALTLGMPKPEDGAFQALDLITPPEPDLTSPGVIKFLRNVTHDAPWVRKLDNWHLAAQTLYRPPDAMLKTLVERGVGARLVKGKLVVPKKMSVIHEALLSSYHGIEDSLAAIRGQDWKLLTLVNSVWRKNHRWIPKKLRVKIGQYMDTPAAMKAAKATELGLGPEDIEVARRAREIYGLAAEKGLAGRFQIDPETFESNYLSRIRKFWLEGEHSYRAHETSKFIKDAFGGTPPRELDAFFRHLRVDEVAHLALETDPLIIMSKYVRIGNRETILGPIWKRVDDLVTNNLKDIDSLFLTQFNLYRSQVMGISQGAVERIIHNAHGRIWKQLGITDKTLNRDLIKMGMSYTYLSAMGGRPWLAVRNSFQIGTTLDPRIGGNFTAQAIRDLSKDKTGALYNRLRETGVFTSHLPVPGGQLIDADHLLGKLTHAGLKMYRNSDELTRAVAYHAAELRFESAMRKYAKGILGKGKEASERFIELSGFGFEPPQIRNTARKLIANQQWGPAKNLLAARVVDETMFIYRAGGSPIAFRGMTGKLFGMMGTYPVYYVENIRRALKYASPAQKLAYATRFVGNSLAFYTAFKSIGVNANNFLPWTPAGFAGGPLYNLMNQALVAATDFRSYRGRQSRAELFGIKRQEGKLVFKPLSSDLFGRWLPTFAVRGLYDAVQLLNQGDAYGAFMTVQGYPYNQELLQEMSV